MGDLEIMRNHDPHQALWRKLDKDKGIWDEGFDGFFEVGQEVCVELVERAVGKVLGSGQDRPTLVHTPHIMVQPDTALSEQTQHRVRSIQSTI